MLQSLDRIGTAVVLYNGSMCLLLAAAVWPASSVRMHMAPDVRQKGSNAAASKLLLIHDALLVTTHPDAACKG